MRLGRLACCAAIVGLSMLVGAAQGQLKITPLTGPHELLWPEGAPGAVGEQDADRPRLFLYPAPEDKANGAAVVVCPGGGYAILAVNHEGEDIARWYNERGVSAFVLQYRISPRYRHPAPLQDAQRAIRLIRSRTKEWSVDPARVGIMGFSAGGHLASTAGTHFDSGDKDASDPIDKFSCRPDFLVLGYPVISFTADFAHRGSRNNLLGSDADEKLVESLCNDQQVTPETPPTFLFHTDEDTGVPPENSAVFYLALKRAKVPAELHIYERGPHGVGLAKDNPVLSTWSDRLHDWLAGRKLLGRHE